MSSRSLSLIVKLPLSRTDARNKSSATSASSHPVLPQPPARPSTSTSGILTQFTQSHLVLALTIQKSKPEGLTIREYCEQLQNNIKIGSKDVLKQQRYVDTTEFWKDQCTKILLEKITLEDKLRCAEESNRLLRQTLPRTESNSDSDDSTESIDLDRAGPSNPRKRSQPIYEEDLIDSDAVTLPIPQLADDQWLQLSSYVLKLKRQRQQLEGACKEPNTIDQIDHLTRETNHMLALLNTQFFDCCLPFYRLKTTSSQKHNSDMLQRVINHVGVSYLACFKSFNELCRTIPGRSRKSEFVFQLVMFLNKSLDFLKTLSELQSEQDDTPVRKSRSNKRAKTDEAEYVVNKYIAKMLSSVIYSLEWKAQQPGHSDLLEGILFSVLEHTGRLLSEAVFNEHIATSNAPGNITQNTELTITSQENRLKQAARISGRYIVQILHAALGGGEGERKDLVARVLSSGRAMPGQSRLSSLNGGVLSGDLLLRARKLLQSTLMGTSVGLDVNARVNGGEWDTLRMPTPPIEESELILSNERKMGTERYGADWLVESVWALVGWDLMMD